MPHIPNYCDKRKGEKLKAGMALSLELMLKIGRVKIKLNKDSYAYKNAHCKNSAHFEHTILITDNKAKTLTKI